MKSNEIEFTVLIPCLNEAETLALCIRKANQFFQRSGIQGEVLIADNGSTDNSQKIACDEGARLINVKQKGYGSALISGICEASGKYIIMGDADDSYDFSELGVFVNALRQGYDLVMGNRFKGGIKKGAMPFLHRYLGNPVLSFIGRLFFKIEIGDFHCGLRGFNTQRIRSLNLRTTGMEFASEMVVKSKFAGLRMTEVPTILYPDGRSRKPHLKTWRDGWRHLVFLLIYSSRWLFLYPGIFMLFVFSLLFVQLQLNPINIQGVYFDIHSLIIIGFGIIASSQMIFFALFSKVFSTNYGLIPEKKNYRLLFRYFNLERGIIVGLVLLFLGLAMFLWTFIYWKHQQYGAIKDIGSTFRRVILGGVLFTLGIQIIFSSFIFRIIGINTGKQ